MDIMHIILYIYIWTCAGAAWGGFFGVKTDNIHKYTNFTIFIGGPLWWVFYIFNSPGIVKWIKKIPKPKTKDN